MDSVIKVNIIECSPIYSAGLSKVFSVRGLQVSVGIRPVSISAKSWPNLVVLDPEALRNNAVERFINSVRTEVPIAVLVGAETRLDRTLYRRTGASVLIERDAEPTLFHRVATELATEDGQARLAVSDSPLSPRESQVLRQIGRGLTHGQIARLLDISQHTVETYVKRIREKLGLGNKAELTRASLSGRLGSYWVVQ
jgi:DNA-binding CsgD family transcriptional regulator